MNSLRDILSIFKKSDLFQGIKRNDYLLADTIIPYVSLYDHSILTSGIAVALVKELLLRGKKANNICGIDISEDDLIVAIQFASYLHDIGKKNGYENHISTSLEISKETLEKYNVEERYKKLILGSIERHHINNNPQTLFQKIICLADSLASGADKPELAKAQTMQEILQITEEYSLLFDEIFEGENGLSVILGDVDQVHAYVFETSRLPEIRGASEILNELNLDFLKKIFRNELSGDCLIYNAGGSFTAIVPKKISERLIGDIKEYYLKQTGTATISCVKFEPDYLQFCLGKSPYAIDDISKLKGEGIGEWLIESQFGKDRTNWFKIEDIGGQNYRICKKKGFGELLSNLSFELRKKKDMKNFVPFYESFPIGRRCESCGKRMASNFDETREEYICNICHRKRELGKGERIRFLSKFEEWVQKIKGKSLNNVYSKIPNDLDALTKNFGGYFSFIYADGNEIGSIIEEIRTPAQYRHFAKGLYKAIKNSFFEAILDTFSVKEINNMEKLPFEIINIGGDDISFIVAAPFSFKFSLNLLKRFEENTKEIAAEFKKEGLKNFTMSVGMIICKAKYPVYYAEKIAESLLKEAKKKAKKNVGYLKSAINYIYLTQEIAAESSKELFDSYYVINDISLIMRPYILYDFEFLRNIAKDSKGLISTSQLNLFIEALSKGRKVSSNFIFYQISKMKKEDSDELFNKIERCSRKFNFNNNEIWNFDIEQSKYMTYLYDLLEIIKIEGDYF